MELSKDLVSINSLDRNQAQAVLNSVIEIHNHLLSDSPEFGWINMGVLIERLSGIVRGPAYTLEEIKKAPLCKNG